MAAPEDGRYFVDDLQSAEPEALEPAEGIAVDVADEPDSYGFARVTVSGPSREAVVEYVRSQWGDEDPQWFADHVVARVEQEAAPERDELRPVQAFVMGAILSTLTKMGDEGILTEVEPVTDAQGFTDTILAASGGERLVVRVVSPDMAEILEPPDPDRLRESIHVLLADLALLVGPDETVAYVERVAEQMREELELDRQHALDRHETDRERAGREEHLNVREANRLRDRDLG